MRLITLLVVASCASSSSSVPAVRFSNAPPVRVVNDRRDVPRQPRATPFLRYLYNFDSQFFRRVTRALELRRPQRAIGINALDEVPSSTWFTNRIGVRDVSAAEIAAAPGGVGSPEPHRPWTIQSSKVGGMSIGFIVKDARGEKFLVKFDPRGLPEAETGAHVIMGKLLWAFGFNVTEDYIVNIDKSDLVLAPDASIKDAFGNKHPLVQAELDRRLQQVDTQPDGTVRVLASHWLPGKPLGGHAFEGSRQDDPNDRIPHELRRDLRGTYALFSWLDHIDIHPGNMLDVWTQDRAEPDRHYVKHYWVDFGGGLGVITAKNQEPRFGYEFYLDFDGIATALASFGTAPRRWENRAITKPKPRGIGDFEVEHYDPGLWKSTTPGYLPLYAADAVDKFWASKIIIRFTREQIRAAVESARFTDPRATEWLTDALIARQRKTARYWFERVNPIDELVADADRLCWKDLAIAHAFARAVGTTYTLRTYDHRGSSIGKVQVVAGDSGVSCARIELAKDGEGYTIVELGTARASFRGTTYVHIARDPSTQAPRVIGIWRP